jgi:hypothetical protein
LSICECFIAWISVCILFPFSFKLSLMSIQSSHRKKSLRNHPRRLKNIK